MYRKLTIKSKLLNFFTTKKNLDFEIKNASKVVFFRYDRIGDMIITTPVFRELKIAAPQVKIIVLASKTNQEVLRNNPYVDEIITNFKNNLLGDFFSLLKLRLQKIDVCIEFDRDRDLSVYCGSVLVFVGDDLVYLSYREGVALLQ